MAIEVMRKFAVATIAATGLTALSLGLATPAFAGGLATIAVHASSHRGDYDNNAWAQVKVLARKRSAPISPSAQRNR